MPFNTSIKRAAALFALGAVGLTALAVGEQFPLFQAAHLPAPSAPPPPARRVVTYDRFGFDQGLFRAVEQKIERNVTFSELLEAHAIPSETAAALAEAAAPVFDVRHLRAGKSLRVYKDAAGRSTRYLVYERDPVRYVVFELGDSVRVVEHERPVTVAQRLVSGVIDGSLYATLDAQEADPALATKLSEVFAWQIDFFRIQKGDYFSVLYEEKRVEGVPVETGRVLAARFNYGGKDYYGIHFDDGETAAFYDQDGNSLRRAFLKAPLKFERISSRYSLKRFHPVQKRWKAHLGTDYAAAPGTPIHAVGDGTVLEATFKRNNGNYVKLRHNKTYTTGYLHMSRIAPGIRPGARVSQGQVIGYVGSTGLATGPHLCYRFWKNGEQVDPLREESPSANPVSDAHRAAFERLRDSLVARLDVDPTAPLVAHGPHKPRL